MNISVKDTSALEQSHEALTAELPKRRNTSANLTDGSDGEAVLNLRGTAHRMPHSQLYATRLYQALS